MGEFKLKMKKAKATQYIDTSIHMQRLESDRGHPTVQTVTFEIKLDLQKTNDFVADKLKNKKVSKILRNCKELITNKKQAMQLSGIGPKYANEIKEIFKTKPAVLEKAYADIFGKKVKFIHRGQGEYVTLKQMKRIKSAAPKSRDPFAVIGIRRYPTKNKLRM